MILRNNARDQMDLKLNGKIFVNPILVGTLREIITDPDIRQSLRNIESVNVCNQTQKIKQMC